MDIEVYDLYKRTYKCDERESIRFAPMISKIYLDSVKKQRDQYKSKRDTLIDDIAVLKANISRLEQENAEQLALLKEFRKLIDYKLSLHQGSLMYREYRSKLDQLGVK